MQSADSNGDKRARNGLFDGWAAARTIREALTSSQSPTHSCSLLAKPMRSATSHETGTNAQVCRIKTATELDGIQLHADGMASGGSAHCSTIHQSFASSRKCMKHSDATNRYDPGRHKRPNSGLGLAALPRLCCRRTDLCRERSHISIRDIGNVGRAVSFSTLGLPERDAIPLLMLPFTHKEVFVPIAGWLYKDCNVDKDSNIILDTDEESIAEKWDRKMHDQLSRDLPAERWILSATSPKLHVCNLPNLRCIACRQTADLHTSPTSQSQVLSPEINRPLEWDECDHYSGATAKAFCIHSKCLLGMYSAMEISQRPVTYLQLVSLTQSLSCCWGLSDALLDAHAKKSAIESFVSYLVPCLRLNGYNSLPTHLKDCRQNSVPDLEQKADGIEVESAQLYAPEYCTFLGKRYITGFESCFERPNPQQAAELKISRIIIGYDHICCTSLEIPVFSSSTEVVRPKFAPWYRYIPAPEEDLYSGLWSVPYPPALVKKHKYRCSRKHAYLVNARMKSLKVTSEVTGIRVTYSVFSSAALDLETALGPTNDDLYRRTGRYKTVWLHMSLAKSERITAMAVRRFRGEVVMSACIEARTSRGRICHFRPWMPDHSTEDSKLRIGVTVEPASKSAPQGQCEPFMDWRDPVEPLEVCRTGDAMFWNRVDMKSYDHVLACFRIESELGDLRSCIGLKFVTKGMPLEACGILGQWRNDLQIEAFDLADVWPRNARHGKPGGHHANRQYLFVETASRQWNDGYEDAARVVIPRKQKVKLYGELECWFSWRFTQVEYAASTNFSSVWQHFQNRHSDQSGDSQSSHYRCLTHIPNTLFLGIRTRSHMPWPDDLTLGLGHVATTAFGESRDDAHDLVASVFASRAAVVVPVPSGRVSSLHPPQHPLKPTSLSLASLFSILTTSHAAGRFNVCQLHHRSFPVATLVAITCIIPSPHPPSLPIASPPSAPSLPAPPRLHGCLKTIKTQASALEMSHDASTPFPAAGGETAAPNPALSKEAYLEKAKQAGWTESAAFDYSQFTGNLDATVYHGTAQKYEWKDDYGDVGPPIKELEDILFGGEFQMRRGDHINHLEFDVAIEGASRVTPIARVRSQTSESFSSHGQS
nr:hypothetical protein CFP56_20555 [Quercus suber]